MLITIVAFEGCMTSAVYGQADAFAIAAYIADRRADPCWSSHDVRIATPDGTPVAGYGGHPIRPHCSLAEACDSGVILIPPIFNDIEQTLAQETALLASRSRMTSAGTHRLRCRPHSRRRRPGLIMARRRRLRIRCRTSSACSTHAMRRKRCAR